jgi:hypothetical protein
MKNTKGKSHTNVTHVIQYSKKNTEVGCHNVYGKTDLFNCLREMMKDGYTEFKIITL